MKVTDRQAPALLAALFAGAVFAAPASALEDKDFNYDTTRNLYTVCSAGPGVEGEVIASFACRAFLEATVQYHDAVTDRKAMNPLICYPKGATIAEAREIFVAWGQANAGNDELMNEPPVKGVVRALAEKYPCKG
jgi:hypothetical protein